MLGAKTILTALANYQLQAPYLYLSQFNTFCMRRSAFVYPFILLFFIFFATNTFAQPAATKPLRIAVLAPLYIDSVFDDTSFKGGTMLPKYMLPGLEFYNGVMMAVDSLQQENTPVEAWVYDTHKAGQSADDLQLDIATHNVSLIIASLTTAAEQQSYGAFAFAKNIPFISATYPNDAGIATNPYFIIINPTLKTHVEGLYKFVQRNYIGSKVYYITRTGAMETKIKGYFEGMVAKTAALKYTQLTMPDNFTADSLRTRVDSSRDAVFICGSLNDNFSAAMVRALSSITFTGQVTAAGMPTWDGAKTLEGDECKNVNIIYSTPYNYDRTGKLLAALSSEYQRKYNTQPGTMVFKGFETMYHFTRLLVKLNDSLLYNISDTAFKICNDYNFQPVHLTDASYAPDYLENKKLYFVKMLNGEIKSVN